MVPEEGWTFEAIGPDGDLFAWYNANWDTAQLIFDLLGTANVARIRSQARRHGDMGDDL